MLQLIEAAIRGCPSRAIRLRAVSSSAMSRTRLLAESWTAIAQQYEHRLAPLFQPWLDELVGALDAKDLPEGDVIVPACGPGIELLMLAEVLPGESNIVGIDLAAGMVDVANARIAAAPDRLLRYILCN